MRAIWQLNGMSVPTSRMVDIPDYNAAMLGGTLAIERLPTEPLGSFVLTLTNVVVGSAIQIEDQTGANTFHNSIAASSSVTIYLSAFGSGSSKNDLRIKVRKGSGTPYYQPYETLTVAVVGAQSIYVSQNKDEP